MPPDRQGAGGRVPTPDEAWLESWQARAWRRWRVTAGLFGAVWALGIGLAMRALLDDAGGASLIAVVTAVGTLAGVVMATRGMADIGPVLAHTERIRPDLRNALVAWHETHDAVPPTIAARLAQHSRAALEAGPWPAPFGPRHWSLAIAALMAGVAAHTVFPLEAPSAAVGARPAGGATAAPETPDLDWSVALVPPAYSGRTPTRLERPSRVEALAGTRATMTFTAWPHGARATMGGEVIATAGDATTRRVTLSMVASDVLLVRDARDGLLASVAFVVQPDVAPRVRIVEPGADLRRSQGAGLVPVRIVAEDDLGLRDLRLRFTHVSGSGESFTFVDGEWPVRIAQTTTRAWEARYTIDLAALDLGPGDSVVYHAVAHDARVGPEGAAESERFIIEVPRAGEAAGGDFSLPDPEDRFALSQRMVILMTERLLERRPRLSADDYRQEALALALAQRRVRAEFVFMLGGEVEDEFEEAAHSHEVEAGRLDNRGQGDLTEAVRQMAQAEARLTDADLREALPFEYRALASLQAAFGKARYFMRTLPVPVRIDPARRLQGDRNEATSARWNRDPLPESSRAAALRLLGRLDDGARADASERAAWLPELVALDRGNPEWVAVCQQMLSDQGLAAVTRALRARLLAESPAWTPLPLSRGTIEAAVSAPPRPR